MEVRKGNAVPIVVLILCCLAFLMLSFIACTRLSRMAVTTAVEHPGTVVVDAGHGGEDGGASDQLGRPEKDINLAIAKDLRELLTASGYHVVMTRAADTSLSDPLKTIRERKVSDIHNRMKIVESQQGCIFVSIHQNQFQESRYNGTQVFYSNNDKGSKELAQSVQDRVVSMLQKDNTRAVKPATSSIYLLWNAKVPAILVECGFLSNPEEAAKLSRDDYQRKMAFAIYCGLLDSFGTSGSGL